MSRKNKVPRDEEKIGFIGLGNMGGALARRLADSRTMVFDRDSRRIAPLVGSGSLPARDSGEIASSCDIILACLPTSSVTEELLFGKQGILPNMRSSQIFIDMTSGDPELSRYQAAQLRNHGIDL